MLREPLGEIVERRQRRDQHDAVRRHPLEQGRLAVEREAVLHGVDAFLDRQAASVEALGVRRDANAEPVRLVDERPQLVPRQLGGLGILADD